MELIHYTFALTECGPVVNNIIKSPGYPVENYPNNVDCNYTISIPPGMDVEYVFHYFKVEGIEGKCR